MAQQSLTQEQMVSVLKQAGWEDALIPWALEVSKRESGWRPRAHNNDRSTGDDSRGPFQINVIDEEGYMLGAERRARYGITNEDLFNPVINARVARDVLDMQGPNAWSVTKDGTIPFPDFDYRGSYQKPKAFNQSMTIEGQSLPGAVYGATKGMDVSQGDLSGALSASFPGGSLSDNESDPRFAASEAVIASFNSLFGKPESAEVVTSQVPQGTIGATNNAPVAGEFSSPLEYLTGDTSHAGFRDDHGGSNYHEHLAYSTPDEARAAASLLNAHGIQTTELKGVNTVGGHSPNSYHYVGQAFDVPAHQVPVGQEPALSAQVRRILRIG